MKLAPQSFAICAPPGFDGAVSGTALLVVIGIYSVIALVGFFLVRDFYRFGRRGSSWLFAVIASGIFSGGGYYLAGPVGTFVLGAPFLVAFGIGRHKGKNTAPRADEDRQKPV